MNLSFWLFDTKWGGYLQVGICLFLAVYTANKFGQVSYIGLALAALFGITGLLSFMLVSQVRTGFRLEALVDSSLEFLAPVAVACFALFIARQLTNKDRS